MRLRCSELTVVLGLLEVGLGLRKEDTWTVEPAAACASTSFFS